MAHYPVRSLLNQNLLRFYSGFEHFYILQLRHLKPHTELRHDCSCLTRLDSWITIAHLELLDRRVWIMSEALTGGILIWRDAWGVCLVDGLKKKYNYSPLEGCALTHLYWRHISGSLGPSNTSTWCSGSSHIWYKWTHIHGKTWEPRITFSQIRPVFSPVHPPHPPDLFPRNKYSLFKSWVCGSFWFQVQHKLRGQSDYRHQSFALIKGSND